MGDEREGRRRSLMGAGPLLGQLHFLPSVEAERISVPKKVVIVKCNICKHTIQHVKCGVFIYKKHRKMMWRAHHAWVLRL